MGLGTGRREPSAFRWAQYESIEHISFSDLQPGDLIFYASYGYIYHVVMYVGGGDVIQAEETGTNVMITALPGRRVRRVGRQAVADVSPTA